MAVRARRGEAIRRVLRGEEDGAKDDLVGRFRRRGTLLFQGLKGIVGETDKDAAKGRSAEADVRRPKHLVIFSQSVFELSEILRGL